MIDILQQKRSYRRGLVLGLTMAESVILIIFALLLTLAVFLMRKDMVIKQMREQITQITQTNKYTEKYLKCLNDVKQVQVLQQKIIKLQALTDADNFDDMFKELELMRQQAQRTVEMKQQVSTLVEKQQAIEKTLQIVETAPVSGNTLEAKLEQLVTQAQTFQNSNTRMINLYSQMANLQRRLGGSGKGTEKPACWATFDGRPEYIFNVALRSTGVMVTDNELPHRAKEQSQLPLTSFSFKREVSLKQFRVAAESLRVWSHQHDCMFFVRIQDQTKPNQKALYKQKLRTVGEYFYYYEPP